MSVNFLRIEFIGNLGKDPTLRFFPSGDPVCNFSVASNRVYNNKVGETVTETTWINVEVVGKRAVSCNEYLHKGDLVFVEGRLSPDKSGNPRIWNKQDGSPAASFEVHAENVKFLSKTQDTGESAPEDDGNTPGFDDDVREEPSVPVPAIPTPAAAAPSSDSKPATPTQRPGVTPPARQAPARPVTPPAATTQRPAQPPIPAQPPAGVPSSAPAKKSYKF